MIKNNIDDWWNRRDKYTADVRIGTELILERDVRNYSMVNLNRWDKWMNE